MKLKLDPMSFWKGFGIGCGVTALTYILVELWCHRLETGEIDLPESYSGEGKPSRIVKIEETDTIEASVVPPKPPMEDLIREYAKENPEYTPYSEMAKPYDESDRREVLSKEQLEASILKDELDEEDDVVEHAPGEAKKAVVEESETETRVREVNVFERPEIDADTRVRMNRRFTVIDVDSYNGEYPYNDKYDALWFNRDRILAGFDGSMARVADDLMYAMAYDAFCVQGMKELYLRDNEGDSDFHISRTDADFDEEYERWRNSREER